MGEIAAHPGKPLESDALLKAPAELARLAGVPAPSLELVHALIDLLTRGWSA